MLSNNTDYKNNLLNQLAYVDLQQDWKPGQSLYDAVSKSGRQNLADELKKAGLGDYVIKDYANENATNGFAGIAFEDPRTGEVGMSFRGTENLNNFISNASGIISGDKGAINNQIDMIDNLSTAVTGDSVQAQRALDFFRRNKSPDGNNYLYGHSKGGELAAEVYAEYFREIIAAHVINPQPINWASLSQQQRVAFNNGKFDAVVVDGDIVWLTGGVPYKVRIVKNNKSEKGFFGPHELTSASYDKTTGQAIPEPYPYKDYKVQGVLGFSISTIVSVVQGGYKFFASLFLKAEYITRDFSESSKQRLLGLVNEVENEKLCDFTDWIGDRWYDFSEMIGSLNVRRYINDVNAYHKKVIDKNNTTKEKIEEIFKSVHSVDSTYNGIFERILNRQNSFLKYIKELSETIKPNNNRMTKAGMAPLDNILADINKQKLTSIIDVMRQSIDGVVVFNEEVIYDYIKKNPAVIKDVEKAALVDTISLIKDNVAIYENLASIGTDNLGIDLLNFAAWISKNAEFESFSAVSAHYNDAYINLLNAIHERSKEADTFAADLVNAGIGSSVISLIGVETYKNLKDIFGNSSFSGYLAKYKSEHTEQYFAKLEANEKRSLKSSGKFNKVNDAIEDKLKKNGWYNEEKETSFYDKNGKEIKEKDAPDFYKRQLTLAEIKKEASVSAALYKGKFDVGENGSISVKVGEAEAHASVSGGFYVVGKDGKKKFSPGVKAEVGASVTALEVNWEQQWFGDENFGLNSDVTVTAGKASAQAEGVIQIYGEDGKLNPQFGVGASAELIGGEIEGKIGVNVLGGEVGVKGSVNYGIGAHADVGYKDGVFKCDIGASIGIGASISLEVDVGGMVNTVVDTAKSAWEGIKSGWNSFWSSW